MRACVHACFLVFDFTFVFVLAYPSFFFFDAFKSICALLDDSIRFDLIGLIPSDLIYAMLSAYVCMYYVRLVLSFVPDSSSWLFIDSD